MMKEAAQLNLALAWMWILLGFISGMVMGLLPVVGVGWLYPALRRFDSARRRTARMRATSSG